MFTPASNSAPNPPSIQSLKFGKDLEDFFQAVLLTDITALEQVLGRNPDFKPGKYHLQALCILRVVDETYTQSMPGKVLLKGAPDDLSAEAIQIANDCQSFPPHTLIDDEGISIWVPSPNTIASAANATSDAPTDDATPLLRVPGGLM